MCIIDFISLAVIILFIVLGYKRGVIKTGIQFIGLLAVLVLSFAFKVYLANFLMKYLPFFDLAGSFKGITAINILIYNLLSFIFLFVIFYCLFSIILSLSDIVNKIVELAVVLEKPSKLLGAVVGLFEGVIIAFLMTFILFHVSFTQPLIGGSKFSIVLLERTPIIGTMAVPTTLVLEDINNIIVNAGENEQTEDLNFKVINTLIYHRYITRESAQELVDNNKFHFEDRVSF